MKTVYVLSYVDCTEPKMLTIENKVFSDKTMAVCACKDYRRYVEVEMDYRYISDWDLDMCQNDFGFCAVDEEGRELCNCSVKVAEVVE